MPNASSQPTTPAEPSPVGPGAGRASRLLRALPLVGLSALTLFLALRGHPSLDNMPVMPTGLVRFLDAHDTLNNVVGFAVLAGSLHLASAGTRRQAWPRVARRAALAALVVVALEAAQLYLPARSCDWRDIVAGWFGILLASVPWVRLRAV